jgi:hypothetical protein
MNTIVKHTPRQRTQLDDIAFFVLWKAAPNDSQRAQATLPAAWAA